MTGESRQELTLEEATTHLLEECRTVLPGIQALFGFQMIAVFSSDFRIHLTAMDRTLHVFAILLVVMAVTLVMAPASLHRIAQPRAVTSQFLTVASRLLLFSMLPLALGLSLDLYVVVRSLVSESSIPLVIAAWVLAEIGVLWFVLPHYYKAKWGGAP